MNSSAYTRFDYSRAAAQASTFGAVNTGQTFGGGIPAVPEVVINEIDYDQAGTDTAEFIELKNVGSVAADLSDFSVQLINGSGGGGAVYNVIALPPATLAPGSYFVIFANASKTLNCDLDVTPDTNLVQNGSPDAVTLWMDGAVVDAVSYEGNVVPPFVEGSGAGLEDVSSTAFAGISRFPDGIDTNLNNVDLSLRCITPGAENSAASENCPDPQEPPPPEEDPGLVINEIHADPASGLSGDANGDGPPASDSPAHDPIEYSIWKKRIKRLKPADPEATETMLANANSQAVRNSYYLC